jgi:PST family polysaccharide transporter
VVPYGYLMRRFQQRELFVISSIDFVISTALSLALIGAGFGVMGLAIGRLAAQLVSSTLQFVFARVVPRFGLARKELKAVLAFGLPVAGANLLGWVLLNVDKIIIARLIGPIALGYYVLAFNVANWPMSALAQVVRSSILPFAARTPNSGSVLPRMTAVVWAAALPAGVTLAALSEPLILVVYGQKWAPAAPVLAALGVYGSLRVAFDIFAGYLYARGQSRPVMWLQLVSLIALVGGMLAVTPQLGILAAAWAQVVVTVAIVLPGYLWVLRSTGVSLAAMVRECLIPTLASLPAAGAAYFCATFIDNAPVALLVGGFVAVAVYALIAGRWLLAQLKALRAGPALVQEPSLERERTLSGQTSEGLT